MTDGEALLCPQFFNAEESARFFTTLTETIAWQHEAIKIFGRLIDQPRLTAWYGDVGKSYTYSGITLNPQEWTPALQEIRQRAEAFAGVTFNSVLLNQYRNERDSVSWHSDDEPELGPNPVIASISFGATRRFHFKHKTDPQQRIAVDLTDGSLLLMRGATQHFWKHQIPKSSRPHSSRINLTFRTVL